MDQRSSNRLINSTSPYLLQHAHNPVDWYPWGKEALEKAKKEDKPILVSIGYSSCHWCHVMEKESFENDSIAQIMNELFVNIKVDREERPDIDQIYMDAVSTMGLNTGWPLNVFLTPDQKPFYGGTYFPPETWAKLLKSISNAYHDKRDEIVETANKLSESLSTSELEKYGLTIEESDYSLDKLTDIYNAFKNNYDEKDGGFKKSPKFPMPSNWAFAMRYANMSGDNDGRDHALFTLDKIALGGIYDHVGGGFARYSTDAKWFAPHFEKMLYDNGQLLSLYAEAYMLTGKDLYKRVIDETVTWLEREMTGKVGGFYSAIDADSEGEEGKFYVWTEEELKSILGNDFDFVKDYYGSVATGNWEHGNNILFQRANNDEIAKEYNISPEEVEQKIRKADKTLLKIREKRIKPAIDTKILSGWNGMVINGLVDAYNALGNEKYLDMAIKNGDFIKNEMWDGQVLMRSYKDGEANIEAYLEDYAFVIQGSLALYEATFDEKWLDFALSLADNTIKNFFDKEENLFYFTSNSSEELIVRKKDIFDNVIPSSNSQMAINLYKLGIIMDREEYKEISDKMLRSVYSLLEQEPGYLSNWAILYAYNSKPTAEIVIVGKGYKSYRAEFSKNFIPNKVILGSPVESSLPLLENRYAIDDKTTIYVCYNKTCKLPVTSVQDALNQLD